jgi:DNA-directed RNA polymerase alpha subunit
MFKEINFITPEVRVDEYKEAFTSPQVNVDVDQEIVEDQENYAKIVIRPLERGYGQTIGNSLRRVLLSSIPGAAIVAVDIEGVEHEFTAMNGVVEDVTEIVLNLKNIVFTINADKDVRGDFGDENELLRLELNASLPTVADQIKAGTPKDQVLLSKVVKAKDIVLDSIEVIKVINPEQKNLYYSSWCFLQYGYLYSQRCWLC